MPSLKIFLLTVSRIILFAHLSQGVREERLVRERKAVSKKEHCAEGTYCWHDDGRSYLLYRQFFAKTACKSHGGRCVACSVDPDSQPNGLGCMACRLSIFGLPVCTDCEEGAAALVTLLDESAMHLRQYCRPAAQIPGNLPQLCSPASQGGLKVASMGNVWRMQVQTGTVNVLARLQPVSQVDGQVLVYLSIFKKATSVQMESRASWAGAMMFADHVLGFYLGNDTHVTKRPGSSAPGIWSMRFISGEHSVWHDHGYPTRKSDLDAEIAFVARVKDLDDRPIESPPVFELSLEALKALGTCFDAFKGSPKDSRGSSQEAAFLAMQARLAALE
eukprot:TRINITY_DN3197_c0_g1_i1.p1 TRINITY_DN3197_c0_g1~~TRINITY_DN3197_c0_g1_i1.p1  ORF type:complete len:332 (-),score=44.83 TRINITY_DN3197_c0_g1_i1:173-1168(-)